jgi:Mrp family chromosome partitioning ATPase
MADPTRRGPVHPTPEPLPDLKTTIDRRQPRVRPLLTPPPPSDPSTRIKLSIHARPQVLDSRLVMAIEPDSPTSASFRALRKRLQENGDPRVIAVTSAQVGEGKTTCAVNLALALGEQSRARVLLMEINLRTPSLAALFGFQPPECFGKQLARHYDQPLEPWSLVETYWPWLHVGAVRPDTPLRTPLDGMAIAIGIERMHLGGYDYIVIDTPAIEFGGDTQLVVVAADGVVLAAMAGRSSGRRVRRAIEQLTVGRVLGIVLLGA